MFKKLRIIKIGNIRRCDMCGVVSTKYRMTPHISPYNERNIHWYCNFCETQLAEYKQKISKIGKKKKYQKRKR